MTTLQRAVRWLANQVGLHVVTEQTVQNWADRAQRADQNGRQLVKSEPTIASMHVGMRDAYISCLEDVARDRQA